MTDVISADVLDLLVGREHTAYLDRLEAARDVAMARLWGVWWQRHPGLKLRWDQLEGDHRARIDSAPEAWTLLMGHGHEERLADWIAAEEALSCRRYGLHKPVWTALGDCFLVPGTAGAVVAHRARKLTCGVVVDWQSPAATEVLPEVSGNGEPWPAHEAAAAVEKIEAALALLNVAAPHWAALIARFDKVVLLRKSWPDDDFSSATTRLALGRPVLRNAHLAFVTPARVADALIHETVHTLLDHVELTDPLVPQAAATDHARLLSPWSSRSLDINTYVHACLVWFALFKFWRQVLEVGAVDDDEAISFLTARARGFLGVSPADRILPYRFSLAPGVLDLIQDAGRRVHEDFAE